MKNRELFEKDPLSSSLLNNGVAEVFASLSEPQEKTLRFELETFVCDGEYQRGIDRILSGYLQGLQQPEQKAVWVSGFFGSGKSHLVKMLRYLWADFRFPDGTTARGIVKTPNEVNALLKELTTAGKRFGGLHAAAGTLGSGAGESVRLAILGILFQSLGLPEQYAQAKFLLWLKKNGTLDAIRKEINAAQGNFEEELKDLHVSTLLAKALLKIDSDFAPSAKEVRILLKEQFPNKSDVSTTEMVDTIKEALLAFYPVLPCTLIALDEVQQYIGENPDRSMGVQEVAQAISKRFDAKLMLIGTGQQALSAHTPYLQKLMDRFSISIQLSDTDVEAVTRKVVLAKKPDKKPVLEGLFSETQGEISRQLNGSGIAYRTEDRTWFPTDYPLLPVRRRLWEVLLRSLDRLGTTGQLRTQLKIVHEGVRSTGDSSIGTVIPGDFIYGQLSDILLSRGILLREIDNTIKEQRKKTPDGDIRSRLCALVFMISKLPREQGVDIGVYPTAQMLADMLVVDLTVSSLEFRRQVAETLESLYQEGVLMKVGEEYRIQTKEWSAWDQTYREYYTKKSSDIHLIESERLDIFRARIQEDLKGIKLIHGHTKTPRKSQIFYSSERPQIDDGFVPIWVRDGWLDDEKTVIQDARDAGVESATVFVYIPRSSADDLKKALVSLKAATSTLETRGTPSTDEGKEAMHSMETIRDDAQRRIDNLLKEIIERAKVYQGGGTEVSGMFLPDKVKEAADSALVRLFPKFQIADDPRWDTVFSRAKSGDGAALEALAYKGDVDKQPVCSAILAATINSNKGSDIRRQFATSPYGWPQDSVDGALFVLVASGHVRASQNNKTLGTKDLDRSKLGVTEFKAESITISVAQRIAIRKLFQLADIPCKPNEELLVVLSFLDKLRRLAQDASGETPLPAKPSLLSVESIAQATGNEQLILLYSNREEIEKNISTLKATAENIQKRLPRWKMLGALVRHAKGLNVAADASQQIAAITAQRSLLDNPDPVPGLCESVAKVLREQLNKAHREYSELHSELQSHMNDNESWKKLDSTKRTDILERHGIQNIPVTKVGDENQLLESLEDIPLEQWRTRHDALHQRFTNALADAVKLLQPRASRVSLPSVEIRNEQEMEKWISATRELIKAKLGDGPVVI